VIYGYRPLRLPLRRGLRSTAPRPDPPRRNTSTLPRAKRFRKGDWSFGGVDRLVMIFPVREAGSAGWGIGRPLAPRDAKAIWGSWADGLASGARVVEPACPLGDSALRTELLGLCWPRASAKKPALCRSYAGEIREASGSGRWGARGCLDHDCPLALQAVLERGLGFFLGFEWRMAA